ncbi:Aste57867_18022 [Aphanomyces stellatus]|uniref:Aste57867_18022 protein n=1 Tax=Aphanomyces stellatus TaxID=120398 RepID=A0A485L9M6_9STRA|nr:hypothetical protein As57867_017960 [Aphanomyces stellatus]VFT94761.1 Aste57867_18022 [Aphanomyces stellatus]
MVDRRVRREKYNAYMVEYRKKTQENVKALKETLLQLDAIYQPLMNAKNARIHAILPWNEVARAMTDDSALSISQKQALVSQLREHHETLQELHAWVHRITRPLNALQSTWRDMTLPAHPQTRVLAMEWIAKRMFLQREAMFHAHGFPPWNAPPQDDIWCDMDISFVENAVLYVARRHHVEDISLEAMRDKVRRNPLGQLLVGNTTKHINTLVESSDNSSLHVTMCPNGDSVRVLCAEMTHGRDHVTFVMQEIVDDETSCDVARRRQNRTVWFDHYRMPDGRTRHQILVMFSHSFIRRDEPLNLVEEATCRGFTMDAMTCVDEEETFRRGMLALNYNNIRMLDEGLFQRLSA